MNEAEMEKWTGIAQVRGEKEDTRQRFSKYAGAGNNLSGISDESKARRRASKEHQYGGEQVRGLVKQHLDSFNYFVNTGIKKIVRANDRIVSGIDPSIYLRFKDVRIGQPSVTMDGVSEKLNPHMCRLSDMTYAAPILVNIEYIQGSHTEKTIMEKNDVVIGRMPIMLRSCCCVLYGKDEAELSRLGLCA
ncbi:hypothetical protein Pint_20764 [Pistacia integerrima]|uniref:Uncharacterized protein n=1 Tax=Pistacia integerrima TaxID=434235 RepID=A0ACC0XD97_9ROSI|nr:hypothetical protein Pint_20764 [Pistacia integerrima]